MTTRMVSLELENFRGFAEAQTIDLDADVILIRGDNGTGKTSLADGILWVLLGQLQHLNDRARGLRQSHDPIANRYVSPPRGSRVALSLRRANDVWRFERKGDWKRSTLEAQVNSESVSNEYALRQAFDEPDLDALLSAVQTWGILRQDSIRSVLDTGGAALHQRMSSIIGLGEVTRFVEACRAATKSATQLRKRCQDSQAMASRRREDTLLKLQDARTTPTSGRTDIAFRASQALTDLSRDVTVDVAQLKTLEDLTRLGQSVSRLTQLAEVPAGTYAQLVRDQAAVTKTSAQLLVEVEAAESQASRLGELASDTQRLAEAALNLLSDRCPVCSQEIDAGEVRLKLQSTLAQTRSSNELAAEARNSAIYLMRELSRARSLEASAASLSQHLAAQMSALTNEISSTPAITVAESLQAEAALESLARRLDDVRSALRRAYAETLAESHLSVEHSEAEAQVASEAFESARNEYVKADETLKKAKRVEKAAQQASDGIVARWLRELEPSFSEVFDRLAPHPTFSELRARQDVYYNKNQIVPDVNDPVRGVSANPLLVYSEGQLNIVALSYFLGLAFNAPSDSVGFMVLDDPLQAMDVLAVLGFADLCRRLRGHRQLIITTHDRRYASVRDRKLVPREEGQTTVVHEFDGWSRSGPSIRSTRRAYEPGASILFGRSA